MGFSIRKTDESVELGNEEVFVSFARSDFEEMIREVYEASDLFDIVAFDPYQRVFVNIFNQLGRLEASMESLQQQLAKRI